MLGLGVVYGFAHNSKLGGLLSWRVSVTACRLLTPLAFFYLSGSLASSEKRHQDYERLKATKLEKERAKLQAGQTGGAFGMPWLAEKHIHGKHWTGNVAEHTELWFFGRDLVNGLGR